MSSKQLFKKLVRFIATDGKIYYGDAILPSGKSDARLAKEANVITGDIFGNYKIEDKTLIIRKLLTPLAPEDVSTVRCLGLNYRKHAIEAKMAIPKFPVLFYKPKTALSGPEDDIIVPRAVNNQIDYECELVVIIGKECKDVSEQNALDYVLGYSVGNDVSQRDWQLNKGSQWNLGKMFDGFAPFGPAIVSPDITGSPASLQIHTKVNGKVAQNETTGDMIFNVPEVISFLSQGTTLVPGDVIFMGTPSGVGMGRKPQVWLEDGDVVEIGLSKVGTILNKVVFEKNISSKL